MGRVWFVEGAQISSGIASRGQTVADIEHGPPRSEAQTPQNDWLGIVSAFWLSIPHSSCNLQSQNFVPVSFVNMSRADACVGVKST